MDIQGTVTLITGGARLGTALAHAIAKRGGSLAMTYNTSQGPADEAVATAERLDVPAIAVQVDLTQTDALTQMMATIEQRFGRLDAVINMASHYQHIPIDALTDADWARQLDVDLRVTQRVCSAALPLLRAHDTARIINVTDWTAASGRPRYRGYAPYYAAKAGVIGLTQVLALELAPKILVNAIAAGPIIPPAELSDAHAAEVIAHTPLGRWGGAEEVAKAAIFLLESDFVTGESVRVDGGRHLL